MSNQKDLLDFVDNPDNLNRAIEGSMEKRQAIIDQANTLTIEQRLEEILSWGVRATEKWKINQAGKYNPAEYADEIFGGERAKSKQALLQLLNEARIDEATHFVVLTDGVKHEVVYKQTQDEYLTKDERIAQLMENK